MRQRLFWPQFWASTFGLAVLASVLFARAEADKKRMERKTLEAD